MKTIQLILVPFIIFIVVIYFMRLRSRLFDRVLVLLIAAVSVVMIALPDSTQTIARWMGVGRGADLVTYIGLVGLSFFCMLLFSNLRETKQQLTAIAREVAIRSPKNPDDIAAQ